MLYRFADCLLDTDLHTVQRAGQRLALPPKAFGVLCYLLAQRARVVSKRELREQVWQGIAISDATLESCLREVRQALGDQGQAQRIIQTHRGHGYRFVAEVSFVPVVTLAPANHATPELPPSDALLPQGRHASPMVYTLEGAPCRVCQRRNPEEATFCMACGTRLCQPCVHCGYVMGVPASACPACGQPRPTAALPLPHLPSPAPLGDEPTLKLVTVLCCAITHAGSAKESRDLATLHRLMHLLQTLALDVVQQYEGRVHVLLGDRLLALFGVPVAREDDARRAVQAALALRHQFQAQQYRTQTGLGSPVALQIGLHTGSVVIGEGQDHGTGIASIVGEVFSVAMALQEQAAPGQMLCSATTGRLVHGMVHLARGLPVPLRGPSSPLTAHAIHGLRTRQLPGRRRTARRQSPFVGRQREMALLHALLAEVEAGRGQVIGIVGEAGIGKSRLIAEFRRSLRQRSVTSLTGQCLSYGSTTPYLPVLRLLREVCGITAADRPDALTAKVAGVLQAVEMPLEPWAPVLLSLLGGPAETAPLASLSPEIRKARTLEALTQLCLRGSQQRPLLLAIEDLHWIDAASEEAMATLIEGLAGAPICLLATYRPGYRPSWLDKSYATQVALLPLTSQDSRRVVESVFATASDPLPLVSQVLTQAAGNPFFLEELAHAVLEQGPDALMVAVPDTVQTVLRARLDRLPATLRGLLQAAAVIGKEIPVSLLQALTDMPEAALSQALRQLQATEFLYAVPTRAAPVYTFKRALTQEVTYASLLRPQQQQYHARLAQVLVEQFPDSVAQQPAEVARHYTAAGLPAQALPYWQRAGEQALERVAMVEAVSHLTQGLELLHTLPETPARHQQELTLCLTLVTPLWMLKGLNAPEVDHLSTRAYALARQWGDSRQQLVAVWGLGSVYLGQGKLYAWRELVASLLAQVQQEHDRALLPVAHFTMGIVCFHSGEFPAARLHLEQGRTLYDPQQSGSFTPVLSADLSVMCHAREAWTMWMLGDAGQAVALSQQALTLAQELGHPPSLAYAWLFAALLQQCLRDVRRVLAYTDTLLALAREDGLSYFHSEGAWLRAWALVQQDGVEHGLAQLQQAVQSRVCTEGAIGQPYILAHLAEACGQAGQPEEGLRVVAEALALVETHGKWWYAAELYRLHGELVLQQAQRHPGSTSIVTAACESAEQHFQQARALAQQQQARFLELRAVMSLSRLWHLQGKTTAARALLAATFETFTEGCEAPDLCSARACLDTLHRA